MGLSGFVIGFADFTLPLSLEEAAELLSEFVFGGIRFVEKDDEYDHITLRLEHPFIGMSAELFGPHGRFTLELCTLPSGSVEDVSEICDLSAMLKQQLVRIVGLELFP